MTKTTIELFVGSFFMLSCLLFNLNTTAQTVCNCKEYIYLNEINNGGTGRIHKFELDITAGPGGAFPSNLYLREITTTGLQADPTNQTGEPWYEGTELPSPHGLGTDLNGFLYIAESNGNEGDIRRLTCDGEIAPEGTGAGEFVADINGAFNVTSIDNVIISNLVRPIGGGSPVDVEGRRIAGFSSCNGGLIGEAILGDLPTDGQRDWGLYADPRTDLIYATNGAAGDAKYLYILTLDDIINNNTVMPFVDDLPDGNIRGVTTDTGGFIYIVVQSDDTQNGGAVILKYDGNGILLTQSLEDNDPDGTGYNEAIGIIYSEDSDLLFVSTESLVDDCIAVFNPDDLSYLGTAVPAPTSGGNGKAIAIIKECCPDPLTQTIDQTYCEATVGEKLFLNELFPCDGIVCGAPWEIDPSTTGMTYDECDQSITVTDAEACGMFTKQGSDPQCGAFDLTYNVEILTTPEVIVSGEGILCPSETLDLTSSTTTTGFTYQWQMSTTGCDGTWSDIDGATSETYTVTGTSSETNYRVVSTMSGTCSTVECESISNCVTVTVENCTDPCPDPNCLNISIQQN